MVSFLSMFGVVRIWLAAIATNPNLDGHSSDVCVLRKMNYMKNTISYIGMMRLECGYGPEITQPF